MLRSLIIVVVVIATTQAQIPVPMGVCYFEDASIAEVQHFCQKVPDCMRSTGKVGTLDCYERCDGEVDKDEEHMDCEEYGMKCHLDVVCVVPPIMMKDIEVDDEIST